MLDWTPNTNHTGLYVAKEKGYFEKEGLDVEIVQPLRTVQTLLWRREKPSSVSLPDSMAPGVAGDNALPNTAVAALIQHNTSGIISRKGEGIEHPKGLERKANMPPGMPPLRKP